MVTILAIQLLRECGEVSEAFGFTLFAVFCAFFDATFVLFFGFPVYLVIFGLVQRDSSLKIISH